MPFMSRPVDDAGHESISCLKRDLLDLWSRHKKHLSGTRESSIFLNKLEEACYFGCRGMARKYQKKGGKNETAFGVAFSKCGVGANPAKRNG